LARSSLFVTSQGGAGRIQGLDKLLARLDAIPENARKRLAEALDKSADDLVQNMKAIAPVAPKVAPGRPAGELREHIHKAPGRHELSVDVISDAQDAEGRGYAAHVEFGHKFSHGGHAPPEPSFFPSIRRRKASIRSRLSRATSQAIKESGQ